MLTTAPVTSLYPVVPVPSAAIPRRLAPAGIARYRLCPRQFWFANIVKPDSDAYESPSLLIGTAVHEALRSLHGLPLEDRTPEMAQDCLTRAWIKHRSPTMFAPDLRDAADDEEAARRFAEAEDNQRHFGRKARELMARYMEAFEPEVEPMVSEYWLDTRLGNGVEVFGKVDRIDLAPDGSLDIVDYKTGAWMIEEDLMADEPAIQAYAVMARRRYGRPIGRVRLLYLESGEPRTWRPEDEDVDDAERRLRKATSEILADRSFDSFSGEHCGRCRFAAQCPDADRVDPTDIREPESVPF